MKSLQLALIAASAYAQEESPLEVTLTPSDYYVRQGDSVQLTCSWALDADYEDYGETKFQMYWKEKIVTSDGQQETLSIVSYNGASDESTVYYGHSLSDRVDSDVSFQGRNATLTIRDLDISDDDMEMFCEIHWNRRFKQDGQVINVYVDADSVELEEIDSSLEGRVQNDNGTIIEPMDAAVGRCTISNVYPRPEEVMFQVGDQEIAVDLDEDDVTANVDGTFTVEAELVLAPEGQYNGDSVSCFSIAAPDADQQTSGDNDTFTLEVFYYTDSVNLVIGGGANELSEDTYSVIEHQTYQVSCQANGWPTPTVTIRNHKGDELANGAESVAARTGSVQHITCEAENNDGNFTEGEVQTDEAELDVFYIEDVSLGEDETADYDDNYKKTCNVEGHPKPDVQWTKGDDDKILSNGAELDLGSLKYTDAGEYHCTASNAAGSQSDSFVLTVDGPCIVEINGVTVGQSQLTDSEHEGQASLKLTCSVQGTNCAIEWESEQENFISQGEIEHDEAAGVNTLFFAGFEQFAEPTEFTCKATNDKGTESDTVNIDEERSPACCQTANAAGLGTGAIVGIVIAIPAILIIIGAAVFFCRKRNDDKNECVDEGDDATEPEKEPLQADHDGEGGNAEDDAV